MKKFGLLLLTVFMPVLAFAQQTAPPKKVYVKVRSENFRKSPAGEIMGRLNAGTELEVLGVEGNWVKVRVEGYIWKPSVTEDITQVEGYKLHAWHILLRTQEEAKKILKMLLNGADFQELAVKYSIDPNAKQNRGDLGEFERGDLIKEFEEAVLKLKPGQISGVVKTPLGYHIIKRIK